MKTSWLSIAVPALVACLGIAALAGWVNLTGRDRLEARLPGADGTPAPIVGEDAEPPVAGEPVPFDGQPAGIAGSWPWFRGPQRDAISHEQVSLARAWPDSGPPLKWTVDLGEGYAGPVIDGGCVYVLDYDVDKSVDLLRCLALDDGREIWQNSYPVLVVRNHGMSRTVPAIAGPHLVTLGPRCHVACWDKETGACNWLIDMVLDYGATVPQWYAGQCPLVDDNRVILAPASPDVLLAAVDIATGEPIWKTPNTPGWGMTHASVVPVEFAGRRMYVYCATGGVVGVSADDGKILWQSDDWRMHIALSPSPLDLGDGRLLLSSGYNKDGSIFVQLDEQAGKFTATTTQTLAPKVFNSEQQTPILYKDHVFGIRKPRRGQFVCLDLEGNEVYNSGKDKFGHGPYMIADDLVFLMGDDGLLTMAAASTEAYRPLGQFQVFEDGHDAWGPMALVAGQLIVRDMTRMACLDVRADQSGEE